MNLNQKQLPASNESFIDRRTLIFGPGTKSSNVYGRVFFCNMASGPFEMNFNDGEFFPIIGRGVEWALVGDDRYSRLQFKAAVPTTIEFYAGNFAYHENVVIPVSKVAQTLIKPGPHTTVLDVATPTELAVGATFEFPGVGPSPYGYRKHFIVTNTDLQNDLDLLMPNPSGAPADPELYIGTIFAQQMNVFESSADLILANNSAGPMFPRILEVFYPV